MAPLFIILDYKLIFGRNWMMILPYLDRYRRSSSQFAMKSPWLFVDKATGLRCLQLRAFEWK